MPLAIGVPSSSVSEVLSSYSCESARLSEFAACPTLVVSLLPHADIVNVRIVARIAAIVFLMSAFLL